MLNALAAGVSATDSDSPELTYWVQDLEVGGRNTSHPPTGPWALIGDSWGCDKEA